MSVHVLFSPGASALNNRRRFGCRLSIDFEVGRRQCGQNLFGYNLLRGKDQGAKGDGPLTALQFDLSNAAASLIGLDKPSIAEHVVEICVWRELDLSGHQALSRLADRHRYHDRRLISLNVDLCPGGVHSQCAVLDQLLKCLQEQAHWVVWLSSDGGLGLFDAGLVGTADRLRERTC